jgi:iduronate 2-sulfatase
MTRILLLVIVMLTAVPSAIAQKKPNVLFISIDDLRPELRCYASPQVKTPHIDKLAASAMIFNRAYCQVAVCGASRASLMTGILPTATRFTSYKTRADEDTPGAKTLPQTFKEAGYVTISNGKIFHNHNDANERSWSEPAWRPEVGHAKSFDPETTARLSARKRGRIFESPDVPDDAYGDGKVAEKTIQDLRRLAESDKPFFLGCGFIRPHMPFYAPKKYWDMYERDKIEIADNRYRPKDAPADLRGSGEFRYYHLADYKEGSEAFHRMMRHGYLASVSYVDQLVGNVLAELERLELADDTIVILWGDHGWHLGEHDFWGKHNTMHLATRVPLIIRVPGKKAGRTDALVETSDIFPTLCGLADLKPPTTVQGRSFAGVLDQPDKPFRDVVYNRFGRGDAVITERYTYTRYRGSESRMLYDLNTDPSENKNLAGLPEYAEIVAKMDEKLNERMAEAANARAAGYEGDVPIPTKVGIKYGDHPRHILDFWQAEADKPTPLVLVIHGGGWRGGSKERMARFADARALLDAGISVAAINYRLMRHAADVTPPVKAPMHDSARALQFIRTQAKAWNIDPTRIGLAGGSAGACTSLWLAYHDDLADPTSDDPVARQSTRRDVRCGRRRPDHARPGPDETVDAQQQVRRARVRQEKLRRVPRRPRSDPAVDSGIFALRAGQARTIRRSTSATANHRPWVKRSPTRPTPPTSGSASNNAARNLASNASSPTPTPPVSTTIRRRIT